MEGEMPYKSEAQRRYMHAKKPKIAKRWDKKYGGKKKKGYRLAKDTFSRSVLGA